MSAAVLTQFEPVCETPSTCRTTKRPVRVLLAEDNEDAMLLVKYALEEYGEGQYVLEWVDRLTPCLDRLSSGAVDVTLLDLGLPETSGQATYIAVRSVDPNVPVIVLTSDERVHTELAVTLQGADEYLLKEEVSGRLLADIISDVIERRKARGN